MNQGYVFIFVLYSLVCSCIGAVISKIIDCLNKRKGAKKEDVKQT